MKNTSMDMADRKGSALRRLLFSADRLRERAIRLGSDNVKTPRSRSSASLSRVTRPDQPLVVETVLWDRGLLCGIVFLGITRVLESPLLITSMSLGGTGSRMIDTRFGSVAADLIGGRIRVLP